MRILVTGGAGFIGSHIVDAYIADGHDVAVMDDLSTGTIENVNGDAAFYEVDISDRGAVEEVFGQARFDVVNHHAAQINVRASVEDPGFDARVNVIGSLHILEAAVDGDVGKVIYSSSGGAVYGEPESIPVSEDAPIRPMSPYGVSKYAVEKYLGLYQRNDGLRYTVLRYANVYGPRQRTDGEAGVIAIFSGQMLSGRRPTIFGSGDKTRDYVYIDDVVEANRLAIERADNEVVNIGTGAETTDQEVYDAVAAAVGFDEPPIYGEERKGDVRHVALDPSRAGRILGWVPEHEFVQSVAETVAHNRREQVE